MNEFENEVVLQNMHVGATWRYHGRYANILVA